MPSRFLIVLFFTLALPTVALAQEDFSSVPSGLLLSPEQRAQQHADITTTPEEPAQPADAQVLTHSVDILTGQGTQTGRVMSMGDIQAAYAQKKYAEIAAPLEGYVREGNVQAVILLGVMLQNGQGVAMDAPRATALFQQAAEAGVMAAQERLALNLASGFGGEKNLRGALMWLLIAEATYADPAAKARIAAHRATLATQMTRSDQDAGQLMARQWLEKKGKAHLLPVQPTEKP